MPLSAFSLGSAGAGHGRPAGFNGLKLEAVGTPTLRSPSLVVVGGSCLFMRVFQEGRVSVW